MSASGLLPPAVEQPDNSAAAAIWRTHFICHELPDESVVPKFNAKALLGQPFLLCIALKSWRHAPTLLGAAMKRRNFSKTTLPGSRLSASRKDLLWGFNVSRIVSTSPRRIAGCEN